MGTEKIEAGMLARSLAGHDKDAYYVVWNVADPYVWLTDGRLRPLEKPKKKKIKHIQMVYTVPENLREKLADRESIRNEDIRRAMKLYTRSGMKE